MYRVTYPDKIEKVDDKSIMGGSAHYGSFSAAKHSMLSGLEATMSAAVQTFIGQRVTNRNDRVEQAMKDLATASAAWGKVYAIQEGDL